MHALRKRKRTKRLPTILPLRRHTHNHQTLILRPQSILQQIRQFTVPERNMMLLLLLPFLLPSLTPTLLPPLLPSTQGLNDVA